MKQTIELESVTRIWPDSYLPLDIGGGFYRCPLLELPHEKRPESYRWEYITIGRGNPELRATKAEHDPVFLFLQDIDKINNDLSSVGGVKNFSALLVSVALHDHRGYLKPQLSAMQTGLKNLSELFDWDKFIERLVEVEHQMERLQADIEDEELGELRARQNSKTPAVDPKVREKKLGDYIEAEAHKHE